jgi:hypothetical protein
MVLYYIYAFSEKTSKENPTGLDHCRGSDYCQYDNALPARVVFVETRS